MSRSASHSFVCLMWRLLARYIHTDFFYWKKAEALYCAYTHRTLDYQHPVTLSEKLMWLSRYWQHPLKTRCADKYLVRGYVTDKGLEHLLIPLIAVYDRAEDIAFERLPQSFILKCNHASGLNAVVSDKSLIDPQSLRRRFQTYLTMDFSQVHCEIHYQSIPRKIVCEPLIADTAPTEYQFWCVNGEPDSILVCRKNFDGSYNAFSYSCDFKQLFERIGEAENTDETLRPKALDDMLCYARILSRDFPFVRVDFFEVNGKVFFAELTFTPDCNYLRSYGETFQHRLGEKLILPPVYPPRP